MPDSDDAVERLKQEQQRRNQELFRQEQPQRMQSKQVQQQERRDPKPGDD